MEFYSKLKIENGKLKIKNYFFKFRFIELFQILYQRLLLGEKLSAQLTDVGINGVFAPHPSKIRDFCHLLPREKALDCASIQLLDKLGFNA